MIVPLITLIVRLIIIMFACIFASNARTPPPTTTVVIVGGDGSGPPHQFQQPPPVNGPHDPSSPALPPYEVKKPLPDDGSRNAPPPPTLQAPTLPMKVYRPNDSSPSTMYPECQQGPSPRVQDASRLSSFSLYKTNMPATEQGEHHGMSMV